MKRKCWGEIDPLLAAATTAASYPYSKPRLPRLGEDGTENEDGSEEEVSISASDDASCESLTPRLVGESPASPASDWSPRPSSPHANDSIEYLTLGEPNDEPCQLARPLPFFTPFLMCVYDLDRDSESHDAAPFTLFPAKFMQCFGQGCDIRQCVTDEADDTPFIHPQPIQRPIPQYPTSGRSVDEIGTEIDEPQGANAGRRRAPVAQASMSLTPAAAAAVSKKSNRHETTSPRHEVNSLDTQHIAVKTPGADRSALKELPPLRDAPPGKREELFILKLQLCSVIFSFDDPLSEKRGKDMKRQTLLELVDYVNTPAGQKIFTESIMGDLMMMVSSNVCRALPPATDDFDPEEDEPVLEPAWPHLQVAYEFFLRFIVSSEVVAKAAKKYVDQKFCLQLVELFDSEDPRERDYLKTILHRIYGKFMSHRSFIRRAISNVFYRFVYETERHNGIGELLEILGSIINGFAIPLKKEHLQFLVRALIPLHKPKCVALYHQQLSYCIIQYVEKDADTATPILNGFFKCWPWSNSGKQVMFLNELEEILELLGADQLNQVSTMLFTNLARCLDCDHFQVVERALFLWNNEHLVNSGCLSRLNASTVLPIIYGPLYKNSSGHWNATVEGLAQNVLKMYMEYDLALYDKCTANYFRDEEAAKKRLELLAKRWDELEQEAMALAPQIMLAKQQIMAS